MTLDAAGAGSPTLRATDSDDRPFRLDREVLSFRTVAILPAVLFIPTLIGAGVSPGSWWGTTFGILYHLAILFFLSRVPAPDWARAAGFGWLTLDVAVGIMTLNGISDDIYMPIRLGGHVMAAVWLLAVAMLSRPPLIRILGAFTAIWLALFSFFSDLLPLALLGPAGVLVIVWLVIACVGYEPDPVGGVRRKSSR